LFYGRECNQKEETVKNKGRKNKLTAGAILTAQYSFSSTFYIVKSLFWDGFHRSFVFEGIP
jgi:hypothetical protein